MKIVGKRDLFRRELDGLYAVRTMSGEIVEISSHDAVSCDAEGEHYMCSRHRGHEGLHVACAFTEHDARCPEEILEEWRRS